MGKRAQPYVRSGRVRLWVIAVTSVILLAVGLFSFQPEVRVSSEAQPTVSAAVTQVPSAAVETSSATPAPTLTSSEMPVEVTSTAPVSEATQQESSPKPPPVVAAAPAVAAEVPTRIVYPEANINMIVAPMDGRPRTLDPPVDSNAHWLNNYGLVGTATTDTAYLVAHSCGLGYPGCSPQTFPFNNLSTRAALGQRITIQAATGEVHYRVTDVFSYNKDSKPADKKGTWDQVPGRLVLISCYTADLLGKNVVVFAELEK